MDLGGLRSARIVYNVKANWKIVVENYYECYYCPPVHPKFKRITLLSGVGRTEFLNWARSRLCSGGFMVFADGFNSMATTGCTKRSPLGAPSLRAQVESTITYLYPTRSSAYTQTTLMIHTLWPKNRDETRVECDFYFDAEEMVKPDFAPTSRVRHFPIEA
jgi:Rieske 2Fe-2S family protein